MEVDKFENYFIFEVTNSTNGWDEEMRWKNGESYKGKEKVPFFLNFL